MQRKHTFNLTYAEGLLLLTQGVLVSALHRQHSMITDQNNTIANLSIDLNKLNDELTQIKSAKVPDTSLISTKLADTTTSSVSGFLSYLDPKILAGIAAAGVIYYGVPYLGAKITLPTINIALPSLKSVLIPLKSAVISLLPFVKEVNSIESIKDGCTYRVILSGDKLSEIEVRRADSHDFEPVADLLSQFWQKNPTNSSLTSSISSNSEVAVQTETDLVASTSQSVSGLQSSVVEQVTEPLLPTEQVAESVEQVTAKVDAIATTEQVTSIILTSLDALP
jgi:methyl-accepting chemotaxis protein